MTAIDNRESQVISGQLGRMLLACLIVAAIVAIPSFSMLMSLRISEADVTNTDDAQVPKEEMPENRFGSFDLNRILETIDRHVEEGKSTDEAPEPFSSEIGMLGQGYDLRVSADGTVIGYAVRGEANVVADNLRIHMYAHGWNGISLEGAAGETFVKSSGLCTWALATCTQVGDEVCVVMHLKR